MITLTPLIDSFSVNFTPSLELDVSYYKVHAVHVSDLVEGDFMPTASNLINQGPETSFVWKTRRGTTTPYNGVWYVKVAAVDTFGEDALNYSSLYSVEVADFSVMPDQLASSLRVDFWVNSSIFTFSLTSPLTTLSWTAGSIERGDHTYALAAGSLVNAGACYLVATLTDAGYTAALTAAPLVSGVPSVADNQVIIGTTSDQALSGGTYVAYMRQANSVLYEGAAIRDLTVTNEKVKDLSADKLTAGTIDANNVTIENLIVGENVAMGENATLSWDKVTGTKPPTNATANNFRGEWSDASVDYVLGDEALHAGSTWGCSVAHTSASGNVPPTLPTTSNTWWSLRSAAGDSATLYQIAVTSPVIFKAAQDAGTTGVHTNITATGKRVVGGSSTTYGYLTITGNGGTEATTATADSITTAIADIATYSSYTIRLYNQATVNGATLLDTQVVPVAYKGATGAAGANGTRTAILEMYKWAAAQPTASFPSGTSNYTWATGAFIAPSTANGWNIVPPAPVDGQSLWVCRTMYSDQLADAVTPITWNATVATSAAAAGIDGENGTRTAYLEMYKWSATEPTELAEFPSGDSLYTWSTGTFSAPTSANGWTILPAAPVAGQTLYACAMIYADKQTTTTSTVSWTTDEAYAVGSAGEDGTDGSNALTVVLSNEAHSVPCSSSGTPSSYTASGTDIIVYEGTTALSYVTALTGGSQFTVSAVASGITCGAITDGTGKAVVAAHSAMTTNPATVTFTITARRADGTEAVLTKLQTLSKSITGATGSAGSNAVTVVLSNEAHSVPCAADGTPSSYTGSGTDIYVYEGTTAFSYVSSITANSQFTVSAAVSGITCGAISAGTGKAVVAAHSGMTANPATVTYTITARKSNATTVTFTKVQTLSKSTTGATGAAGPVITLTASKQAFTFTDNTVDAGQADITFAAVKQNTAETVTWVSEPAGLVSGTGDSKTLSATTFGTNSQAVITISTPSGLTDKLTVVRLNKSTASANATSDISLVATGQCVVTGNTVKKVGGVASWDSSVYSLASYTGGCYCAFMLPNTGYAMFGGLNTDPTTDSSYTSIDYAWYISGNTANIRESGNQIVAIGSCTSTTVFAIKYDGSNVIYMMDGVVKRTVAASSSLKLYFDSSFNNPDGMMTNICFAPVTSNNWGSIGGAPTVYTKAQIDEYATTITNTTVNTAFINALDVTAKDVQADWVYAGGLSADQVSAVDHIKSANYDGSTTDPYGTPGTLGWCFSKTGGAALSNVKVRGDVQATSLDVDIVNTQHLVVGCVSTITSATSPSTVVTSSSSYVTLASITVTLGSNIPVIITGKALCTTNNNNASQGSIAIFRSGTSAPVECKDFYVAKVTYSNGVSYVQISGTDFLTTAGSYTYTFKAIHLDVDGSAYPGNMSNRSIYISEVKR